MGTSMETPSILGRTDDDDTTDQRATTRLTSGAFIKFEGGAVGQITVSAYQSNDDEDRGGVVLRVTLENDASSFTPVAKNVANGIEIHMAGDIEGKALIRALKSALAAL